jgi:hypothetical protein
MPRTPVAFDFWYQPVFQDGDGVLSCDGCTGPTIANSIHDKVFFGQLPTPGVADVEAKRERKIDVKDSPGVDGCTTTIHGIKPADITIRLLIWTPEQYKALRELWPLLMTPPYKTTTKSTQVFINPLSPSSAGEPTTVGTTTVTNSTSSGLAFQQIPVVATKTVKKQLKVAVTFDVSHPKFKDMGIKAVQIVGGWGPDIAPIPGARIFTIKCIEYLPKGKAVTTQTDVKPMGSLYDPPDYPTPDQNGSNLGPR